MRQPSVMALFCEDVREEVGGTVTLVGILPDNLDLSPNAPPTTKWMPKFWIYLRIHFDPEHAIGSAHIRLILTDGTEQALGELPLETIEAASQAAKVRGNAHAGIVTRLMLPGDVIRPGRIRVDAVIDGETYIAGGLNFVPPGTSTPTSSSAH